MAAKKLLNPIISLLMEPKPSAITGGGKNRSSIVMSRLEEQRFKLIHDLSEISAHTDIINSHAGCISAVVRMFDDSFAPSYTPNDLFNPESGSRIITPFHCGYLIEVSLDSIDKFIEKITSSNSVPQLVDISRICSISIFDKSKLLRGKDENNFWRSELNNESHQFNIWMMPFYNNKSRHSVVEKILGLYNEKVISLGYSEFNSDNIDNVGIKINDKIHSIPESLFSVFDEYVKTGKSSFSILINKKNDLNKLISCSAISRIDPITAIISNDNPPGEGGEPIPPLTNIERPAVVVVDGGCSAKSYEHLNMIKIKPLISDCDANKKHGNQVISIVCNGYSWNSNLSLPPIECNFISAQAIAKNGVINQPTSDQFISYLREVAIASKGRSNVWNLSFNESRPSINENEISKLGHEISLIAREFGILPIISIGNACPDNPKQVLCPPADCEAAITVSGRTSNSVGKPDVACSYSLIGPAPAGMIKPELSWYSKLRVIGGIVATGTSYSTPLVSSIAAHTFSNLKNPTPDLVRALLINKSERLTHDLSLGWGTPWNDETMPWVCEDGTVTLTWVSKLNPGFAYYWNDIPLPPEMLENNMLCGSISLTAILKPKVSDDAHENYFSTRLECALQSVELIDDKLKVKNLLGTMKESKEQENKARAELSKWSPIRHHAKDFKRTNIENCSLRLYARTYTRDLYQYGIGSSQELGGQEVAFVLTFKSNKKNSNIYSSMTKVWSNFIESAVVDQEINIDIE